MAVRIRLSGSDDAGCGGAAAGLTMGAVVAGRVSSEAEVGSPDETMVSDTRLLRTRDRRA